jgi:choline dehydrogenase-like flavoprotein
MLGGRTNHWGRISLRFGPHDFMRKSLDGLGDDWPITYDDIKPFYDKIDRLIGIFGAPLEHAQRAGRHLPAAAEAALLRAADQEGLRLDQHPERAVSAVDPHPAGQRPRRLPLLRPVRRGCATHSNFSSPSVLIRRR